MFGEAFEKCIGCSSKILEAFKENREEFLIRALNKPDYLEDVTGITQMLEKIKMDEIENFDFDDDMI
jgi:ubiquitin-like modifier-activating enzyme ATG7